jgi:tetratricopeptide (TPR) repeat protein/NAD-dependent SIR2 family protein deacetylase
MSLPSTIEEALEDITTIITESKLALVLGSGISKSNPSNIPGVGQIKEKIMKDIVPYEKGKHIVTWEEIHENYQFEQFLSTVFRNMPTKDYLANIYKVGSPNKTHKLVSYLALNGAITEIFTTNFDTKIEEAAIQLDSSKSIFHLMYNETHFSTDTGEKNKVPLIKIHGCADHPDSIRTTLELVSSRTRSENRSEIIYHFFKEKEQVILCLGYGFSDYFDIDPVLKQIKKGNKIIHIDHKTGLEKPSFLKHTENLKGKEYPPSIGEYDGYRIVIDTNYLIELIENELCIKIKTKKESYLDIKMDWQREITEWSKLTSRGVKSGVAGMVFHEIRNDKKAELLLEKSCEYIKEDKEPDWEWKLANAMGQLALVKEDLRKMNEAENLYIETLTIFRKHNDKINIGRTYHNIGNIKMEMYKLDEATELFNMAVSIFVEEGDISDLLNSLGQLSYIKRESGELEESIDISNRIIKIAEELGSQNQKASALFSIGTVKIEKSKNDEAKKYLNSAKDIFIRIGNLVYYANTLCELSKLYHNENNMTESNKLLNEALEIYKNYNNIKGIASTLSSIGLTQRKMGNLEEAKIKNKEALEIHKKIDNKVGVIMTLNNLAVVNMDENNIDIARNQLLKSLEIAKSINYKKGIHAASKNLKELHEKYN